MTQRRSRTDRSIIAAGSAALLIVSTLDAHDFWLVPHLFAFSADSVVRVDGQSGTRFPAGSPVHPSRVAEAWVIGAAARSRVSDLGVDGNGLRLEHRPRTPGTYVVAVALTPRTTRTTFGGMMQFLKLEGGVGEAARLERDWRGHATDSVVFASQSYGMTAVQVGQGGAGGWSQTPGFALEYVPMGDPATLRVGDTLRVRVLGRGTPIGGLAVDARSISDSSAAQPWTTVVTDASGVALVPLLGAGAWLLRSARASTRSGTPDQWDIARSTYVFGVRPRQ